MAARPRHRPVDSQPSFPTLEEEVLKRWRERDVFRESIRRREGAPAWVFYEGPPTANGRPGAHHVLSRVFKDLFPRYRTMCGYSVERKGGWDCHGLPVEIEVERQLGIRNKDDVERYGIAEFNQRCRESVFEFLEEWNALTERIGFWLDLEHAYRTLDPDYIESVWWALRRIWDEELLHEAYKVVPYCPRCGTALSSHEVALGYRDVVDPSVFVRFPVVDPNPPLEPGDALLAWTTMPWTLAAHAAMAVDPDLMYVRARLGDEVLVVAEPLVERVLGDDAEVLDRFSGSELLGTRYEPPFPFIPAEAYGERVFRAEEYEHSYPHCWRCGTPLIYYAKPAWYIRTSAMRDRLLAANETVNWYPEHIKHGRFGQWLENNVDWALSRERYWGTPLPVWRCENGHVHCIGSFAELRERSGRDREDPHRPYVDEIAFPCADCGLEMRRVPEVIDVWFDSGAMPFAQYHAPFENEERFRARHPANFVCEALDQTRGWFYSLLAISVLLFDRSPYETVVCLGLILDAESQKMSKSKGNIVVPWDVIDRFGADALRWYYFTSKQPWDGYRFNVETMGESIRLFRR